MSLMPRRVSSIILTLLVISACAAPEVAEKPPEMYWPLPPEKPRIKFVDIILGSLDATTKLGKLKSSFFGTDNEAVFVKPFGVAAKNRKMYVSDVRGIYFFDFEKGR